ncbi:MAG: hypothetical protein U5K29_07180 [Acidimicrobiales bacterium]|nr:hypothetical protein [Acidimicrobiales bacterium]
MSNDLLCPNCGSDEHLAGEPHGDLIRITCSACDLIWDRDPAPRCASCGSTELRPVPQAVWEKSRGTQLSIVAMTTVYLCPDCDRDRLRRFLDSGTPLPPPDNPAGAGG